MLLKLCPIHARDSLAFLFLIQAGFWAMTAVYVYVFRWWLARLTAVTIGMTTELTIQKSTILQMKETTKSQTKRFFKQNEQH